MATDRLPSGCDRKPFSYIAAICFMVFDGTLAPRRRLLFRSLDGKR